MKIGIVGGGAIGLLFASYLARNNDITVYTRTEEQANILMTKGLHLVKDQVKQHVPAIQAFPFSTWSGKEDFTIVTVKQYQLEEIIHQVTRFSHHQQRSPRSMLFLQNGMGHLALLSSLQNWNIYIGSVEHGALRQNVHTVEHTGVGTTKLAIYAGDPTHLHTFIDNVDSTFPFIMEDDYEQMLIKKLTVNAAVNPLTAILRVRNGAIIENPYYYDTLKNIVAEMNPVLELTSKNDTLNHIVEVCKQTANNQSSMLKDLLEGRPTEVDAILGYLITRAQKMGVKIPLIHMLYQLIKGCELQGEEL